MIIAMASDCWLAALDIQMKQILPKRLQAKKD
jgi:hypothetical protein